MVMTQEHQETAAEFGKKLDALRERDGYTYAGLAQEVLLRTAGLLRVSDQTIANYCQGKTAPEKAHLETVCVLAAIFDEPLVDISVTLDHRREVLILASRWMDVSAA